MAIKDFDIYQPMFRDIDKTSILALLSSPIMVFRRIILLYLAMFKEDDPLIQVIGF